MANNTEDPKPSALSNARFRDTIFPENQLRSDIVHTWETYNCRMINSCRLVVSFNKAKITLSCREVSASGLRPAATFVYPDIPRVRFCPRNAADAQVRYYHDTADYDARLCSGQRNRPVFNLFDSVRIALLFFILKWSNRKYLSTSFYQPRLLLWTSRPNRYLLLRYI